MSEPADRPALDLSDPRFEPHRRSGRPPVGTSDPRMEALEAEREFLLASLRDLEAEHSAGDLDERDYETLRDGYTKRAADVLRQLDHGRAAPSPRPPTRWRRRVAVAVVAVAAAAGLGWVVADSSGRREAGQEITGRPVEERDDVASLLTEARALLTQQLLTDASDRYRRVLELDPDNAEALTYLAWVLFIGSGAATDEVRAQAAALATEQLERAATVAPDYPDPHCFLAVIARNSRGDSVTARAEAERCLALDPPGEIEGLVRSFLAGLDEDEAAGTTTG